MNPYYQDSAVTIYHGDNAEILQSLGSFDLLLTDPPYGIGKDGQSQSTGRHGGRKGYDFKGWDSTRPTKETFDLMISKTAKQIIWGGNYFADILHASGKWLVWDKGQRINQSDGELAWTSEYGALRIFTLNRVELMTDGAQHPTQKPLKLMTWCIAQFDSGPSRPDVVETILDPFGGSGTTARAAKDMGKKCVLIEKEEAYCEISAKRMLQEVLAL